RLTQLPVRIPLPAPPRSGQARSSLDRRPLTGLIHEMDQVQAAALPGGLALAGSPRISVFIGIGGMTCASCAGRVERAIRSVPGVAEAAVNLATESARLEFRPGEGGLGPVVAAIERAGYAPVLRS